MAKIENPNNWFLKLFTLGKTFSSKTFFDNLKKHLLNIIVLFISITFTLWIEKSEVIYEREMLYWDLVIGIREDFYESVEYTKEYITQTEWVKEMYEEQYDKWEIENDTIFLSYEEDEDGGFYYSPMAYFHNSDPFNPPFAVGESFDGKDIHFNSVNSPLSLLIQSRLYGDDLYYLKFNTNNEEKILVDKWKEKKDKWAIELKNDDMDDIGFWVKHRKYIQNDKAAKRILYHRIELWETIQEQLDFWVEGLEEDIEIMDSIIGVQEKKKYILFWSF